jgi:hypothetical protein
MSFTASLVKTGKVVQESENGTTRYVGIMVRIVVHNFLARKDKLTIDFYGHLKSNPGVPWEKQQTLFTSKLKVNLRKKLVKCYVWSTVLYGAENGTLRNSEDGKF